MKIFRKIGLLLSMAAVLAFSVSCKTEVEPPHEHKFAEEWTSDESNHWHAATCEHTEAVNEKAEHTYGTKYDEVPALNFRNGSYKQKCSVCNHVKTVPVKPEELTLLNTLGTLKVLQDTELSDYGITEDSVPTKIAGATYVTFGVYPQTIMASGITVADGTAGVNNGTDIKNTEITGADYYLGSDGSWYAKAKEKAYESGYKYSDETTVAQSAANSEKYFKVEPIVWRVLKDADGKYMLLAEKLLTANVAYYGSKSTRTLSGNTVYANNYKYSNIRAFLNGTDNQFVTDGGTATDDDKDWSDKGFLQQAFTTIQQAKIAETNVDNSAASTTDSGNSLDQATTYVCDNTTDKIFLLSEKEATTSDYSFAAYNASGSGNKRIRKPTDYAKANYCYTYENTDLSSGGWWWLRTPCDFNNSSARNVYRNGYADRNNNVYNTSGGVLPALFVTK